MFHKNNRTGTDIIKRDTNANLGYDVYLLRRTAKSGAIRHGVSIKNNTTGKWTRLKYFDGAAPAFALYKTMLNA